MPGRLRWVLSFALLAVLAAAPSARATLVFDRFSHGLNQSVWAAADDGSGAHLVARGWDPRISPDGLTVAYLHVQSAPSYRPDLMVVPVSGGSTRRLMAGFRDVSTFAWSPDSSTIAAVRGPELGPKRLVLVDVASGAQDVVARGFFSGVSFSPDGSQIVYGRAARERFPLHSDIYRLDLAGGPSLQAIAPVRITHDHRSLDPLWGPERSLPPGMKSARPNHRGNIVFVKLLGAKQRRYGPKNELYLMWPNGENVWRLTHTRVDPLLFGLTPTDWSADGIRLLAEFGGQDTSYAVTVNPSTGTQRTVGGHRASNWLIGAALSADGTAILCSTGGFEPDWHDNVVSVPYAGGPPTILARNAFEPDWSR